MSKLNVAGILKTYAEKATQTTTREQLKTLTAEAAGELIRITREIGQEDNCADS